MSNSQKEYALEMDENRKSNKRRSKNTRTCESTQVVAWLHCLMITLL